MSGPWAYTLCAGAGRVAGTLNVVARGGSFLTLPILLLLGVPASEANVTNRVRVVVQNASATWSFQTYRLLDGRWARTVVAPVFFGSVFGNLGGSGGARRGLPAHLGRRDGRAHGVDSLA